MRKFLLPIFTGFCLYGSAQQTHQSLLSAAGGHAITNTYTIDWSLGEPVVETAKTTTQLYTQGFLQPHLLRYFPVVATLTGLKVSAFPNPVRGRVNLKFSVVTVEPLLLSVFNTAGAKITEASVPQGSSQFSLNTSGLAQGSYLLSIKNDQRTFSQSINLIKIP